MFIRPDEAIVDVEATGEGEAIVEARKRVVRDYYYKVIRTERQIFLIYFFLIFIYFFR